MLQHVTWSRGTIECLLQNLGIVNILHCKKLRLAVQEATMATPTPLEGLGHNWVSGTPLAILTHCDLIMPCVDPGDRVATFDWTGGVCEDLL